MTPTYPDYENPTMIYTADNRYTVVPAAARALYLAAGWLAARPGDGYTEPTPFEGDPGLDQTAPATDLAAMTKAQLLDHAQEVHGLELSDKLTKAQILDALPTQTQE